KKKNNLKFHSPFFLKKKGKVLSSSVLSLRVIFRFQLTNMDRVDKVAQIDMLDCEAEQNIQSNIEVNNILRGNFKLVVDAKMRLSNKRLRLRVHCRGKPPGPQNTYSFETKQFYIEFGATPGAMASSVGNSKDQHQVLSPQKAKQSASKRQHKVETTSKVHKKKQEQKGNKNGGLNLNAKKKHIQNKIFVHFQWRAESTEIKNDEDKVPLGTKPLQGDGHIPTDEFDSEDMGAGNAAGKVRLSLVKSEHKDDDFRPSDVTDSSEEADDISDEEKDENSDSPVVAHATTQESIEIYRLMKRKFSTRAPSTNNSSTVLDDPDLVIVVGYSDSEDEFQFMKENNNVGFTLFVNIFYKITRKRHKGKKKRDSKKIVF
ncbi:hypothetical protein RFI_07504, partial [Reticulomyxa filosa]